MDYFKVNGISYNVLVKELEENFNILYSENTGRTLDEGAPMMLDPLGTFYGHKVTISRQRGYEAEYDELYTLLSQPSYNGLYFEIAHNQETIAYEAYVSSGARKVSKIDLDKRKIYWGELQINIIPLKAQVLPE